MPAVIGKMSTWSLGRKSSSPSCKVRMPKTVKMKKARMFKRCAGVRPFKRRQISTPITSAAKSPIEHASQTTNADFNPSFAPKVIAVSCVLSPSSATKKVENTARNAREIFPSLASSSFSSSKSREVKAKNRKAEAAIKRISQVGI